MQNIYERVQTTKLGERFTKSEKIEFLIRVWMK